MSQKLLITVRLLWVDFLGYCSGIYRFPMPDGIEAKALLLMFFCLISLTGHAQLATETFESGIPATWAKANSVTGTTPWTVSTDGYQSSGAAFVNPAADNIGAGNTAEYFLISPLIKVPANGEIRFFTKQSAATDNGSIYQIRLSTAGQPDINGFTTTLASWTETELNPDTPPGYIEKVVAIPGSIAPGLNIYIAFVLVNKQTGTAPGGDTWFIDNVGVQTAVPCDLVKAADFSVGATTSTSAALSWTNATTANFQIQVIPAGQVPAASGTATGNTYAASGLKPDTPYDVYIKSVCGSSTSSSWAGPFTFRTAILGLWCTDPVVISNLDTAPFSISTNLDQYTNPEVTYTTQGSGCLPSDSNYLNGNKAFFTYTPTVSGLITITQTTLSGGTCYNAYSSVLVYEGCANVGVNCLAGTSTTVADVPKRISNLQVQAGKTYIIVVSSILDATAGICFTLKVEGGACAAPSEYTFKNLLQNSVSFSWNNIGNYASAWQYAVQPADAGAPTGTGTATATNTDNAIGSLAAGTAYDLYVRSVCGGTPGSWGQPVRFTTQCPAYPTPYTTAFDTATASSAEACWTAIDVNNDGLTWAYQESWDKPGAYATLLTSTNQANNNDMLVSPQVTFTGAQKRLRYKHQALYGTANYAVKLSTTGIGKDNFTYVLRPDTQIATEEWEEVIINIPATITGAVNIAWIVSPTADETAMRFSIDEVFIEDKPACSDPVKLTVGALTTTTAELSWTAGDAETQWQVVVQPVGGGVPTVTGELVSGNTYTAKNLTHSTQYEFYVRAYCSDALQSNWAGPAAFTTACGVFTTPFKETFNPGDVLTSHKSCWAVNDVNADGTAWQVDENTTAATIQGGFFGTADYDDWLISPAINVQGAKALKFKYKAAFSFFFSTYRYGLEVLMSTTDTNPESFTVIAPLMVFTNTDFIEKTVYINANGPVYIAFRVPPAFSAAEGTSILNIDDVIIEDAPSCPDPSVLTVKNITKNSAALSWTKGFQESKWEVKVQPAGSGIPTADGIQVTSASYAAATLLPNTQYEYYVRAVCSDTDKSGWVGPIVFTTLCNSYTAPFTETFDTGSASKECWRIKNANADGNTWSLSSSYFPYEGDYTASIYTSTNGKSDDWLISPTITVGANQRLRFYYRGYQEYSTIEDLEVKLSVSGVEIENFTVSLYDSAVSGTLQNTQYKEMVLNLPAGVTGDINIAFHIPPVVSNDYYRGVLLNIDNVIIENIPACASPSNLTVSNITDTQAKIAWDANGTETKWEVYVQPSGLAAPAGSGDAQYNHAATASPYTVTGLTAATKYDYYVRAVCSDASQSQWVGPLELTTRCSFENLCEYTVTLSNSNPGGVDGVSIDVIQNGITVQQLEFPSGAWNEVMPPEDHTLFLCTGVEYSLYFSSVGWAPDQFPGAQVQVKNAEGVIVYTSEPGLGTPKRTMFTGIAACGTITCPQPKDLTASNQSVLSWTAGGTEDKWEVAIQPLNNGTLPQSGTIVATNSYTPVAADFNQATAATYEYFVRAICSQNNTSYWSGPYVFVRNNDAATALAVPVNPTAACAQSATNVSFINATASADATACDGINAGDVWFEFKATATAHTIELSNFSGNYYTSDGVIPQPKVTLGLYKVQADGSLQQITCAYNNMILTTSSSALEIGQEYKVRLTLNDNSEPNPHTFDICITTPGELCTTDLPNYDFEYPKLISLGMFNMLTQNVVPGWRSSIKTELNSMIDFYSTLNPITIQPYSGAQFIQLIPEQDTQDPTDLVNVTGLYQDIDSSEITKFNYSYAYTSTVVGNGIQLFAGPPAGPFTLVEEQAAATGWQLYKGSYNVPAGQETTRFIFRSKDNGYGNMLDAANIVADNTIITTPYTLACTEGTATLKANGVGTWVADDKNPSATVIATPGSSTTSISGFTRSGNYTFYWKTRYCDYTIVIASQAIEEVPAITSPVTYCMDDTALALTAVANDKYSLVWYTTATGGTANTTAPVPLTTAAGTTSYYVAYANAAGCEGPRAEIKVVVKARVDAVTAFNYDAPAYCIKGANPVITLSNGFTAGGIFTATPAGLTIDAATGAIDLKTSLPNVYKVKYSIAAGCYNEAGSTADVTVNTLIAPVTGFSYADSYCSDAVTALPQTAAGFTTGGVFSATNGLAINAATGEINIAASNAGTYTVTYMVAANEAACNTGGKESHDITILGDLATVITDDCTDQQLWLHAAAKEGSFDGDKVTYVWKNSNGAAVGSNSANFNVSEYYAANTSLKLPLTFTVTVGAGSCSGTESFTVQSITCMIQRGISPNGDGDNDTFDLTNLGVKEITIFNRYGLEVYHHNGNYTNEWNGQDKDHNDLPDGTYFYSIHKAEGGTVTGWIYINREH